MYILCTCQKRFTAIPFILRPLPSVFSPLPLPSPRPRASVSPCLSPPVHPSSRPLSSVLFPPSPFFLHALCPMLSALCPQLRPLPFAFSSFQHPSIPVFQHPSSMPSALYCFDSPKTDGSNRSGKYTRRTCVGKAMRKGALWLSDWISPSRASWLTILLA